MSFATGKDIADEVFFRINGRLTATQCVNYVNRSLALMAAAGSFKWDQTTVFSGNAPGGLWSPNPFYPLDPGKKISVFNSVSKTPVVMIHTDEISTLSRGYVDQIPTEFNTFRISYTQGTGAYLQCHPDSVTSTIDVYYSMLPPTLTYGVSPTVRWDTPWMDSVLVDYTEALISRIFRWTNYAELEQNAKARLIEAAKIYSVERINTGPVEEAATAKQEDQSIGRA